MHILLGPPENIAVRPRSPVSRYLVAYGLATGKFRGKGMCQCRRCQVRNKEALVSEGFAVWPMPNRKDKSLPR
jgi:aerobic-type carbon monoxide dehydrogenase small subunit (CoxS/CutS family)